MSLNKSKALRTAEKYVLQGKLPAAIDEYRKVVGADPTDLTTINTLGDLYVRAGRIQEAISNFSRIAESYRESGFTLKAIAMLKKISKLDPTNVETSMKLANLYSQQGLLVEARQQYLQVADSFARQGQTRKALEAYQKIADLDPANTSVRMKLGEIYMREGMTEQSHDAFIMAGAEFLRKGDAEQALNANLKAITINPESRQGLTAIAAIYTQQGQSDRAINILCDAFEKNPGDVELLTILGRTYLSAGLMDDAERTFLSLVELDRNRYHYLLEVGRRFLQLGDLDRAAEQIDGCLEVLIAKREEDKAIDFLRRVLDRDMNHIGSLKRLAQIFQRIREDHNLIATLNSLVEAAMRKGDDQEAITALKELVHLEPDDQVHLQRLHNLGVREIAEPDAPDVVRATGPLDFQSAAFDDAFVIRQISEAEIHAGHGQVEHAVELLSEILKHTPDNVQIHLKLKDIYLRAADSAMAAAECLELARIHEARGESARAGDYVAEAHQLNPALLESAPKAGKAKGGNDSWEFSEGYDEAFSQTLLNQEAAFEMREATGGLDLSRYQTGVLTGHSGFVTVPADSDATGNQSGKDEQSSGATPASEFRYSDTLVGEAGAAEPDANEIASMVFKATGNLPSDTMARALRDELEGIDFYIAQGYLEIAQDTLDRLLEEHGPHPELLTRYRRLGIQVDASPTAAEASIPSPVAVREEAPGGEILPADQFFALEGDAQPALTAADQIRMVEEPEPERLTPPSTEMEWPPAASSTTPQDEPFLIDKQTGALEADLMVYLNTSELGHYKVNTNELLGDTAFDSARPMTGSLKLPEAVPVETGDLIDSLVSNIETNLAELEVQSEITGQPGREAEQFESAAAEWAPADMVEAVESGPVESVDQGFEFTELARPADTVAESVPAANGSSILNDLFDFSETEGEMFESIGELLEGENQAKPLLDFETHYSLGLAYKDMDLLDEAIEQFQMASKMAAQGTAHADVVQCCHLLGVCFNRKMMPKVAIMWFQRGLKIPDRSDDEYQALRYEIGLCYEAMNEVDKAIDALMEVYGIDVNYRQVGEKIKELQALKGV